VGGWVPSTVGEANSFCFAFSWCNFLSLGS